MEDKRYRQRIAAFTSLMRESGLDVLLLAKPANMIYLTGWPWSCSRRGASSSTGSPGRPIRGGHCDWSPRGRRSFLHPLEEVFAK